MSMHTDEQYIANDPFFGCEADITCRTVKIRTARKVHTCYSLDGNQDHVIQPGERYRHERALVDGSYWGEYRICLKCMDKHLAGFDAPAIATCVGCGCDDMHACSGGCTWLRVDYAAGEGVCSECPEQLSAWDADAFTSNQNPVARSAP